MSDQAFLKWLDNAFFDKRCGPIPVDSLSNEETTLAEKIKSECENMNNLKRYSKLYLQALTGTEVFYEISIRALSALIKISRLGEEMRDIDDLCRNIVKVFSQELEFENCSIMLTEPDGKHLRLVAGMGKGDKYNSRKKGGKDRRIKIGEGVAGKAAETGEFLFIPDVTKDSRFKQIAMKVDIVSLLSLPVKSNEEIIGVMNFSHPLLESFDENKINLMVLLSGFVGQIITLTRLHNRATDWNETLHRKVEEKTAELLEKNRQLHKIAITDSLTGIYNRRFFFMRLEEEFSRTTRYNEHFSLLVIDLDNLKPINDTYGHITGDQVIKGIARFLKKIGRKGDTLGRIGGDEFGYILLNTDEQLARAFALRLQDEFSKVEFKRIQLKPTVSIGIASTESNPFEKYQEVYRAADDALYVAKKKRNSVSTFTRIRSRR